MTDPTAKPRWYRLTPGRLLPLLLAVEGFLWLSDRFCWFAFNQHKGYTVLIAVASVGVFLLLMFLWFLAALVFRWRFQFSILSLLVLVVAVALPFSWLATEMKAAREQKAVVEWIRKAGGPVVYDYRIDPSGNPMPGAEPPVLAWLRKVLGDNLFMNVMRVYFQDNSEVTDAGLEYLEGLTQLQSLNLSDTKVTDTGLEHLKGLTQLQKLWLHDTKVSDAGLEYLKGLTQLQSLNLSDTNVSDTGLEHLKGLTRLLYLGLNNTKVSDAGLEHLKGLSQLQGLSLDSTQVSDAGVKKLQQALPKCQITH